jgi:GT2 family glycosyltransferase
MGKNYRISVVIPTFNSWSTLKDCLISINKQSLRPLEIIVVDNSSSDGTAEEIMRHFPEIKLVVKGENTGVTGGRNAGIKAAKNYDFIFFFDHDMVAKKDMLSELIKIAASDKKIGIVTPKIFYWDDKNRIWAAGTGINLWTGQVSFREGRDVGQFEKDEEVQVAPAAMLVKADVVKKLRGFDEKYFATYEDTDFCFGAKKLGFITYYAYKAVAWHKIPSDSTQEARRLLSRSYYIARNRILFMRKFGKNFLVFLLFIPFYSLYYLRLSMKYQRVDDWYSYMRGVIDGLADR